MILKGFHTEMNSEQQQKSTVARAVGEKISQLLTKALFHVI